MTTPLDDTLAHLNEQLEAIEDFPERFEAIRRARSVAEEIWRAHLRKVALGLKAEDRTWPQVGEVMGGVSGQRAHQISKGE